jgi:hypothetical protein
MGLTEMDICPLFLSMGFCQSGGERGESGHESGHEPIGVCGLLGLAPVGMATETNLCAILAQHTLQFDSLV